MSRNEQDRTKVADPEVAPTAVRRQFSNAEKLRILEEADACTEPGEMRGKTDSRSIGSPKMALVSYHSRRAIAFDLPRPGVDSHDPNQLSIAWP